MVKTVKTFVLHKLRALGKAAVYASADAPNDRNKKKTTSSFGDAIDKTIFVGESV